MRRILYTLLGLMLWVSTSQAQITNASSTDFVILLPPAADSRLRAATDSVRWMSDNRIGTILIADTAWSHNANADSLEAYTKGDYRRWPLRRLTRLSADRRIPHLHRIKAANEA